MERKCANWLACSFSTDCPANTGKIVSDFTGTTGSQFFRTSQDHKQNESGKTLPDTSRTTDSRSFTLMKAGELGRNIGEQEKRLVSLHLC